MKIEWDGQLARDLREVLVTQARSNGELARFKARISLSAHRLHEHKLNKDLAKARDVAQALCLGGHCEVGIARCTRA